MVIVLKVCFQEIERSATLIVVPNELVGQKTR